IDDTRLQLARAEASTGSATELLVAATAASARAVELARERGQLQAAAAEIRARSVALEAAARREQHLLAAIETAQRVHLSTFDWSALNAAYDRAFASFASQPEELAAAVRQSLRPAALIAALDDWGLVQLNARVDSERLDRVLDEVDPDADRRRLRTATGDVALAESILARGLHCLSPRTCVVAAGQYLQCGRMEDWLRVLVAAHAVHPDDYWVAFLLAEEYGRRGDAEGRARAAAAAAAIRPHSFGAVNLAAALCDAGRWHEADALTRELLRQRPDGALERAHRIRVLADLGHEAEAVALLADLPDGPERLHALMRLGRPEEAEIVCRRLLAQRPRDPDLLLDLGRLHAAGGRAADALTCYRRAFEADPTHADAAIALADASRDAGDPETALSAALAASELLPDSAQVAAVLGYVDRERGELDAALQHYRRAWLAEPDLPGLWREFSACLLRRGDSAAADEALQVLTAAVADRPEDPEVRYTKAFLHWQRGEHELVLVETTSLLRGHPEHFETLRLRFYSAQELGCRDLAADAIDAIARQRTDDIDLACAQADALRAAGRLRSALAAADRACALDGTRVEPRVSRGRVLVAMGRFSTALEVLRPLAQLEPARADVQALLGRSLLAVGRPSEAVSAFERALPLDGEPELPVGSWLNEARTRAAAGGNVGGRPSGQR
ncbi:MAG: tetratricopeptide repeat protein, partial [Planctomycetes bacterium]|nr:tetratricopeptide repeat protein [Planctomycetota bacterium]